MQRRNNKKEMGRIHEAELKQPGGEMQPTLDRLIAAAVEEMYSLEEENRFLEVTYANGDKEVLYFKDFVNQDAWAP